VSFVGSATATTDGAGLATFTGLGLSGTLGNYTLTFTVGALSSAASNSIALAAGQPTQLSYSTQPSTSAQSGAAFAQVPVLLLQDAANNPVSGQLVTATVTGAPAGVSFVGSATATTDGAGLATFTGLGLNGPAGNYTLTFTANAGALSSPASNSIALGVGQPTQLSYTTQPSTSAQSGAAFAQQPVLLLQDSGNNPVDNTVVTATITGSPAGVSLVGTTTATTNSSGVATFTDLGLSGTPGNYTLTFTVGALSSAASNSIALAAGPANQLAITTEPVGAGSGALLATQPVLVVQDAQGNTVTTDNSTQVTGTINSGNGGSLGGTQTATAVNGVVTFTDLTLSGLSTENYVLRFGVAGDVLTPALSTTVTVSVGAATQLTITTEPETGPAAGAAFNPQPAIQLRDSGGNLVAQAGVTITADLQTVSGGPATLGGTLTADTDGNGLATFGNLSISASGTYRFRFTSASTTEIISVLITIP